MDRLFNDGARVVSRDGLDVGTVERVTGSKSDAQLVVRLDGEERTVMVPFTAVDIEASDADTVVVHDQLEGTRRETMSVGDHARDTLELKAEEMEARVHEVDRGRVLIDKTVELVPHRADVEVGEDVVDVERVAVGEEFNEMPQQRQEGDTLIIPVVEEVLVVTKRYRVIEEVRVTKRRDVHTETFEEDLKREVVVVTEEDVHGNEIVR